MKEGRHLSDCSLSKKSRVLGHGVFGIVCDCDKGTKYSTSFTFCVSGGFSSQGKTQMSCYSGEMVHILQRNWSLNKLQTYAAKLHVNRTPLILSSREPKELLKGNLSRGLLAFSSSG